MAQGGSQSGHDPGRVVVVEDATLGGRRADGHPGHFSVHAR